MHLTNNTRLSTVSVRLATFSIVVIMQNTPESRLTGKVNTMKTRKVHADI